MFEVFHLPRGIQENVSISVYGQVSDENDEYSINFANSHDDNPPDITYQFKCNLISKRIQQNIKENDEWRNVDEFENDSIDGPSVLKNIAIDIHELSEKLPIVNGHDDSNNMNSNLFLGPEINLEFIFKNDTVQVYVADSHNYITSFELENDISDVKSIQIGGMKFISKLIFDFRKE